uniref:Uncharacterized protein n=1 Tax=Cacopsylla melanoneura TaxID=428564 RepID=A0A8D9EX58_9HEMI
MCCVFCSSQATQNCSVLVVVTWVRVRLGNRFELWQRTSQNIWRSPLSCDSTLTKESMQLEGLFLCVSKKWDLRRPTEFVFLDILRFYWSKYLPAAFSKGFQMEFKVKFFLDILGFRL